MLLCRTYGQMDLEITIKILYTSAVSWSYSEWSMTFIAIDGSVVTLCSGWTLYVFHDLPNFESKQLDR